MPELQWQRCLCIDKCVYVCLCVFWWAGSSNSDLRYYSGHVAHRGLCPKRNPPGTHCQHSWELTTCPVFTSCLNFGFVEASTPNLWKNLVNKGGRELSTDPGVESLPANAEDTSSIPGWRNKIPRAAGQLSLRATARNQYSQINKYLKTTTTTRERNQESNTKLSRLPVLRQLEKAATHRSLHPYYFQSGGGSRGLKVKVLVAPWELLTSCSRDPAAEGGRWGEPNQSNVCGASSISSTEHNWLCRLCEIELLKDWTKIQCNFPAPHSRQGRGRYG